MKDKKLIFIIYSLSGGGAERHAVTIANYLVEHGYELEILLLETPKIDYELDDRVKVVFLHNCGSLPESIPERITVVDSAMKKLSFVNRVRLKYYKTFSHDKFDVFDNWQMYKRRYSDKLRDYIKDKEGYTVFSWMTIASIATCVALQHLKNELIIVECSSPFAEFEENHPITILKKKFSSRAQKVICQTYDIAGFYDFLSDAEIYVIPNPIKQDFPERYQGVRQKKIVTFSRITKVKNIPLLIDAFHRLHDDYPDYRLHIFGNGAEKNNLIAYAKESGLENAVMFFDHDPHLHSRIRDYAMYVASSIREGISNSMLEAMAIGLPTISTDSSGGGARMIIRNNVNGILIPVNDVQAMYEAMKYIVEHPDEAEKMSVNAAKIREELSIDRIGQKWVDAICE